LEQLHLLASVGQQSMLHVDPGERSRQVAQIGGRRTDQAAHLAERPMRGCGRLVIAGYEQRKPFRILAARLDPERATFDNARRHRLGTTADMVVKRAQ
jgi:hypothetical protein